MYVVEQAYGDVGSLQSGLPQRVCFRDLKNSEMGQGEPTNCVRTTFQTNYPDLENFRQGIAQLIDGESHEATLVGQ